MIGITQWSKILTDIVLAVSVIAQGSQVCYDDPE
jgi:hypothetical protein